MTTPDGYKEHQCMNGWEYLTPEEEQAYWRRQGIDVPLPERASVVRRCRYCQMAKRFAEKKYLDE